MQIEQSSPQIHPVPGGDLVLWRHWLKKPDVLMQQLLRQLSWNQRAIQMFGRHILEPRKTAWASERPYRYSGVTLPATPIPGVLRECLDLVNETTGCHFNSILLNHYRNGQDGMGWHTDNEPELGDAPAIASLSLGQARRFVLRPRGGETCFDAALGQGDLLLMRAGIQQLCQHAVPKTSRQVDARVSLTFRQVVGQVPE